MAEQANLSPQKKYKNDTDNINTPKTSSGNKRNTGNKKDVDMPVFAKQNMNKKDTENEKDTQKVLKKRKNDIKKDAGLKNVSSDVSLVSQKNIEIGNDNIIDNKIKTEIKRPAPEGQDKKQGKRIEEDKALSKKSIENDSGSENMPEKMASGSSRRSRRGGRGSSRRRIGYKNNADFGRNGQSSGIDIDTGIKKDSEPVSPSSSLPSRRADFAVPEPEKPDEAAAPEENQRKERRKKNPYSPLDYGSVQMMASLRGFAPLGMLFVLMDVLKGREEGLIHINQLAQALSIGKPSLLAQLENLEAAGLLRTLSSSRMGRHVELLSPNQVRNPNREAGEPEPPLFPGVLSASAKVGSGVDGAKEAGGQFSAVKLEGLARYLERRGVTIVSIPDESDLDPRVSQIAAFLGKYLSYVLPFYETLKATLNEGPEFSYSLAGLPGRDVTHTLNFCRMLQEVDFLASYAYRRSPHCKIVARVNRTPAAINFLTGGWLEHFIRDKVVSILTTHPATLDLPYAFMKNPRIILPGEEDFELDLLLSVGERIFWIEAKTGEYMDFLPKYSRVSKVLGLNRNTSMLVSVDALAPADNLSARYELSCCNLDEFADVFRINLVRELQQGSIRRRRG